MDKRAWEPVQHVAKRMAMNVAFNTKERALPDQEGLRMWTAEARQRYAWTRRKEGPRLTDPEWALLEPLLPPQASMGRPWKHPLRTIMDAILYLMRTGCAWSALPDWAPPRSTVYEWCRRLADGGWLERLHHALLLAVREHQGREASPTLGIVDSQTVKVMAPAGPRGYDAAKGINGRKRHILVDSCGNLLAVRVTDGAVQHGAQGPHLGCGLPGGGHEGGPLGGGQVEAFPGAVVELHGCYS